MTDPQPNRRMLDEEWRSVVGYESHYMVSSHGRVCSLKRGKANGQPNYLRYYRDRDGYVMVDLWRNGRARRRKVHIVVAEAFLGLRPTGHEVRHLDGIPAHPCLTNLTYGTRSENGLDKRRHGTDRNVLKQKCPRGHPYDQANTYVLPSRPNARYCRTCQRDSALRRYHAARAALTALTTREETRPGD